MTSPQIQFDWLNHGNPVDLPDIPMAGDDELDALAKRHAKTISLQRRSFLIHRYLAILSVKKVLDMGQADRARAAWEEALAIIEPPQSHEVYQWPKETFASEFEAYFRIEIEQKHQVQGFEEANAKLNKLLTDIEQDWKASEILPFKDFQKERLILDLWWRLKRDVKTIHVDGQDVPFTKENLRQAIRIPGDWAAYAKAVRGDGELPSPEDEREAFFAEPSEEDVKKNSESDESSIKQSRIVSPSTSGSTTAPVRS